MNGVSGCRVFWELRGSLVRDHVGGLPRVWKEQLPERPLKSGPAPHTLNPVSLETPET